MNITDFTPPQRQALLDLLLLGMYAGGHLAVAEDQKLHELRSYPSPRRRAARAVV